VTQKIHHLGIAVQSINDALPFYEQALGLKQSGPMEEVKEQGVRVCFLGIGESRIELLEPLSEDTPVGKFIKKRGQGIHHLCCQVDDIEKALENCAQKGIRLIDETPRIGAHQARVAFIHPQSTGGVLLELLEKKG